MFHYKIFQCNTILQGKKLGQFAMHESRENWLCPVNSCVYYAHHTHEIHQVLPYSVDFKALKSTE